MDFETIVEDFGFSVVSEEELPEPTQVREDKLRTEELDRRLTKLYNTILPLLNNLRKNPESDYILWPNRVERIDEFESVISEIVDGDDI